MELTETKKDASKDMVTIAFRNADNRIEKCEKTSLILKKCVEIEAYTIEKYKLLANQTTNPHAKILFERLSAEGRGHSKALGIIREALTETGEINKSVAVSSRVVTPKNTRSPRYTSEVEETYHAMKSHLELERGVEETYAELAGKFESPRATSLFRGLAEDEKTHHEELLLLIRWFEKTYGDLLERR